MKKAGQRKAGLGCPRKLREEAKDKGRSHAVVKKQERGRAKKQGKKGGKRYGRKREQPGNRGLNRVGGFHLQREGKGRVFEKRGSPECPHDEGRRGPQL